ncbi:TIGR02391 family protein [Petrachloros mirabilis]
MGDCKELREDMWMESSLRDQLRVTRSSLRQLGSLRSILSMVEAKVREVINAGDQRPGVSAELAKGEIAGLFRAISREWPQAESEDLVAFTYYLKRGMRADLELIQTVVLPNLNAALEAIFKSKLDELFESLEHIGSRRDAFRSLLHRVIIRSSYRQFQRHMYRDAVLNSVVAVFDLIRMRTGLDEDGISLVARVFSLTDPILVLSTLESESGRNEQKGFIQILQGTYIGVRNPKAHSLNADLTEDEVMQYLVFASLLARRVEEAVLVERAG